MSIDRYEIPRDPILTQEAQDKGEHPETPFRAFDNTRLEEVQDQLVAPDSLENLNAPVDRIIVKEKVPAWKKWLAGIGILGVAGGGVAVGVAAGSSKAPAAATSAPTPSSAANSIPVLAPNTTSISIEAPKTTVPEKTSSAPTTSASEVPPTTKEATPTSVETSVETDLNDPNSAALSVEKYTTPQALGTAFIEQSYEQWSNAGSTPTNARAALNAGAGKQLDYAKEVSTKNMTEYADVLFVKGWENNAELKEVADSMIGDNAKSLYLYFLTANNKNTDDPTHVLPDGDGNDLEAFRQDLTVTNIQDIPSSDPDKMSVDVAFTNTYNTDKNRSKRLMEGLDTRTGTVNLSFVKEGQNWKLSGYKSNN
jgi:hypothetical protein